MLDARRFFAPGHRQDRSPEVLPGRVRAAVVLSSLSALMSFSAAYVVFSASSRLLGRPVPRRDARVTVLPSVLPRSVRISGDGASRPGRWGLAGGSGGYMMVGDVVRAHEDGSVSRRVVRMFSPVLEGPAVLERHAFPRDAESCLPHVPGLGLVAAPSGDGELPMWVVGEGSSSRAFVGVHGRGSSPSEWLRVLEQVRERGWVFASVSYRNDGHAPGSGLSSLGWREADDLVAQLVQLHRSGVRSVVLGGISFGGSVVACVLGRYGRLESGRLLLDLPASSSSGALVEGCCVEVSGVMLESPAIDWVEVVSHVASSVRVPGFFAPPVLAVSRLRARLDPAALRPLHLLDRVLSGGVPVLVVHGAGDMVVPVSISDRLASSCSSAVYLRVEGGGHADAFNVSFARYRRVVRGFLRGIQA